MQLINSSQPPGENQGSQYMWLNSYGNNGQVINTGGPSNVVKEKPFVQANNPLIFAFGQNSYGELGVGDTQEKLMPTHVPFFDKL